MFHHLHLFFFLCVSVFFNNYYFVSMENNKLDHLSLEKVLALKRAYYVKYDVFVSKKTFTSWQLSLLASWRPSLQAS